MQAGPPEIKLTHTHTPRRGSTEGGGFSAWWPEPHFSPRQKVGSSHFTSASSVSLSVKWEPAQDANRALATRGRLLGLYANPPAVWAPHLPCGPSPLSPVAGHKAGPPSGRRRSPILQPQRRASPLPGSPASPPRPGLEDVRGASTRRLDGTGRARSAPPPRPREGRKCWGVFVRA